MPEDKLQNCLLFLENMSLGGIGARGDTKYQKFTVKVYFSELKAYFVNLVPKRLISILD